MRKSVGFFLAGVACVLILGGCEETKQKLGINVKMAPDEFAVYSRAALSVPPDFSLRPPAPGTARPQEVDPRRQAELAVTNSASRTSRTAAQAQAQARTPQGASAGTQAILKQTGALDAQSGIRGLVDRETTQIADSDRSFADRVLFWQTKETGKDVVDPGPEAQRIRGTQALGQPITDGKVPTIERRKKGLFEGIF
ncbi:MAG: DUF3035 domain-containing protein [Rhodospirillales bacterium]|nr:DUF3035 domain-containing protein [Rhodospirillales bacterium]